MGGSRILDNIMKEGGDDGVGIQLQLRHDLGHRQGVDDIGLAALSELAGVGVVGKGKGVKQPLGIHSGIVGPDPVLQGLVPL